MGYDYADENISSWKLFENEAFIFVEGYFGCTESVFNQHFGLILRRTYWVSQLALQTPSSV